MAGRPKTCAVMFADLAGSTALYDKLGNAPAKAAVQGALERMARITVSHGGRVVKNIGDEILVCFDQADAAASAAFEMQHDGSLRLGGKASGVRIGFHFGDVIADDNDIFGDVVNVAARLTSAARAGQTLTTETAIAGLAMQHRGRARAFDVVQFKGKTQPMRVFELMWDSEDNVTRIVTELGESGEGTEGKDGAPGYSSLELALGSRVLTLDEEQMPFTLGRDAGCGLIVPATRASRVHAQCEYQRGKFVLADHSTNGTYVAIGDTPEMFLRRESTPLLGSGTISLGSPAEQQPEAVVKFRAF